MSRRLVPAAFASTLLLVMTASSATAALPGDLDSTFSSDGIAVTNFTPGFDSANALAIQSDLKIVAIGQAAGGREFALARYNSNGSLDAAGFRGGKVTTDFTTGYDAAFDGTLDLSERIVAVGRAGRSGGRFAVARYNTDGGLDATFSGDGKAIANFTPGDDFAFGVAVQPSDGKIVAVGRAASSGGVFAVVRFNTDGSLDTTFSSDGRATTNFTAGDDRADEVAVQADGKIVVAGSANYFGRNGKFALARYNTDGTLDTGFSRDGRLTTDFTPGFDGGFAIAVQPADQHIVASGQAGLNLGIARYNSDGTLDTSFNADGKATTNFTRGADYADDVLVQDDGKIVAAGAANFFGPDARFALARYTSGGMLDSTFSGDGKLVTNMTAGFDGAYGVALAPDGNIVAGGYAGGSGSRFAVARYVG